MLSCSEDDTKSFHRLLRVCIVWVWTKVHPSCIIRPSLKQCWLAVTWPQFLAVDRQFFPLKFYALYWKWKAEIKKKNDLSKTVLCWGIFEWVGNVIANQLFLKYGLINIPLLFGQNRDDVLRIIWEI